MRVVGAVDDFGFVGEGADDGDGAEDSLRVEFGGEGHAVKTVGSRKNPYWAVVGGESVSASGPV